MKRSKQHKEAMLKFDEQMEIDHREGDLNRARSVTVGTCFGGTTEIMMRGNKNYMWTPMQPVEVVELIHQLAANIGCHIHITPRDDFGSWRKWREVEPKQLKSSHAPFPNDMAEQNVGQRLPPPEEQPGMQPHLMARSKENVMATKEFKNRRSAKRTAKAA